ncbi:hypothetical protein DXG01_016829, partial [Tephrocybe rancida]
REKDMGGCVSSITLDDQLEDKARSDAIDKQIEEDEKKYKLDCKLLLLGSYITPLSIYIEFDLGPDEYTKSTLFKQMKIVHQSGFTQAELEAYRPVVYKNILDSIHSVLLYMRKARIECASSENALLADKILASRAPRLETNKALHVEEDGVNEFLDEHALPSEGRQEDFELLTDEWFAREIAEAIHLVSKDPTFQMMMDEHSSNFHVTENASYFFAEILRIGVPGYIPNETDVLRAYKKPSGVSEERFVMGTLPVHMIDVSGLRSERRKWIHCFESVTSVIFCTALSEYDQNQMMESLLLFEAVVNSRWFLCTSIILLLTKIDHFKAKLAKVPLVQYFPEYTGGQDVNEGVKYIMWKFMVANQARLSVYPHLMQPTPADNIQLIFNAVKETILQNAIRQTMNKNFEMV